MPQLVGAFQSVMLTDGFVGNEPVFETELVLVNSAVVFLVLSNILHKLE